MRRRPSNDGERFRPRLVLAESHTDPPTELDAFMLEVGYRRIARLTLTYVYEQAE